MAQLRNFQFLRNTTISSYDNFAAARAAAETAFAPLTLKDGEIALFSYKLNTEQEAGYPVHTLLGIKREGGIEIVANYDEIKSYVDTQDATTLASAKTYTDNQIADLNSEKNSSNNGVRVTVKQVNGVIESVTVVATSVEDAINALNSTVRGTSHGRMATDTFTVSGATGAYVAVEVVESQGILTGVNVIENIDEVITSAIQALDTPVGGVSSEANNNVKVTVEQKDGIVTKVAVVDNSVNATDVNNAITTAIAGLESTATGDNGQNDIHVTVNQENGELSSVVVTDTLKTVAHTGAAADVTIADTTNLYTAENVEDALAEVMTKANALQAAQLGAGKGIDIVNNKINADLKLSIDNETVGEGEQAVTTTYLYIKDTEGNLIDKVNAAAFVKDGFLQKVEKDATTNELIFTWNTDAEGAGENDQVTRIAISDLCDVYTADETYLHLNGYKFEHKLSTVIATAGEGEEQVTSKTVGSVTADIANAAGDTAEFKVPTITVDRAGHVTSMSEEKVTVTLPASIGEALQGVSATGDNYITATFAPKDADKKQALTISAITGSVTNNDNKLAVASDVKSYVDEQIRNLDLDHSITTVEAVEDGGIKVGGGLVSDSDNDYKYTLELVKVNTVTDKQGNLVISQSNTNESFADDTNTGIRVMSGVTVDAYGRVSAIQYKTIEEAWDCGTYGETTNNE